MLPRTRSVVRSTLRLDTHTTPVGPSASDPIAHGVVGADGCALWARYAMSERLSVWGATGYGASTLTLDPEGEDERAMQADFTLALAALDARGELLEPAGDAGGPGLALVSDAMFVRTESESTRGLTAALSFDPRPSTHRGLTLSLRQTFGAISTGGADALMGRETLTGLGPNDSSDARRLELTADYGVVMFGGRFTGTPETGVGLSDTGRNYRLGWRLGLGQSGGASFELSLEATRRESANDNVDPEHTAGPESAPPIRRRLRGLAPSRHLSAGGVASYALVTFQGTLSLMEQASAFAHRMQDADFMCIAARSKGHRVTCQPAKPRQFRRSGQTHPPAKAKFSRRHALSSSPGPSPSLLRPDASTPARTTSAAGIARQRVSLLYEVRGRLPLPSMSNAGRDPGHTLERVTVVTPLSETTLDTLPKHQQRGGIQSALQVLTVPFASTPPRHGGAYFQVQGDRIPDSRRDGRAR